MKSVLITGSGSGLGLVTAKLLVQKGYRVIATVRDLERAEEIRSIRGDILCFKMDVTNERDVLDVRRRVEASMGKLDVLINNAGYSQGGFLDHGSMDDWKDQFETNLFGVVQVTKAFLPLIRKSDNGKIINVSSISGFFGFPGLAPYVSSKFALEGFSESLRLELLNEGISVSVVQPASYRTNIWKKGFERVSDLDPLFTYQKNILLQGKGAMERASDPSEVARVIWKICESPRPKFRYPIGRGAKSLSLFKAYFPWWLLEKVVLKKIGKKEGAVYRHR